MGNSFEPTNTLKGIAIIAVLINHYLNMNVSTDSSGFANLLLARIFKWYLDNIEWVERIQSGE